MLQLMHWLRRLRETCGVLPQVSPLPWRTLTAIAHPRVCHSHDVKANKNTGLPGLYVPAEATYGPDRVNFSTSPNVSAYVDPRTHDADRENLLPERIPATLWEVPAPLAFIQKNKI